jgi:hypothetical protein
VLRWAPRAQSTAVGAALRNPKLQATERIVGAVTIMEMGSRASRGHTVDPWRPTIDAPAHPETPEDGERVGLATELGLSRNTVAKALDAFADPGGPLQKQTVQERDNHGRVVRSRIELRPSPTCSGGVPGMYWQLARFDPDRPPKPEPPEPLVCQQHPEAKICVRTVRTAVCTIDGEIIDEQATTTTAPRPAPTHVFCAPVAPTSPALPGTYVKRANVVRREVCEDPLNDQLDRSSLAVATLNDDPDNSALSNSVAVVAESSSPPRVTVGQLDHSLAKACDKMIERASDTVEAERPLGCVVEGTDLDDFEAAVSVAHDARDLVRLRSELVRWVSLYRQRFAAWRAIGLRDDY